MKSAKKSSYHEWKQARCGRLLSSSDTKVVKSLRPKHDKIEDIFKPKTNLEKVDVSTPKKIREDIYLQT